MERLFMSDSLLSLLIILLTIVIIFSPSLFAILTPKRSRKKPKNVLDKQRVQETDEISQKVRLEAKVAIRKAIDLGEIRRKINLEADGLKQSKQKLEEAMRLLAKI